MGYSYTFAINIISVTLLDQCSRPGLDRGAVSGRGISPVLSISAGR